MFRILKDWKIDIVSDDEVSGRVYVHPSMSRATIYDYKPKDQEPEDFLFHEYLHCAIRALLRIDRRKWKKVMAVEEELIQDICLVFLRGPVYSKRVKALVEVAERYRALITMTLSEAEYEKLESIDKYFNTVLKDVEKS